MRRATAPSRRFLVVAYDVSSDHRRERIARVLLAHGERVQKSVFECRVTERERATMRQRVEALLERGDAVRYYELCAACEQRTSGVPPPDDGPPAVLLA